MIAHQVDLTAGLYPRRPPDRRAPGGVPAAVQRRPTAQRPGGDQGQRVLRGRGARRG